MTRDASCCAFCAQLTWGTFRSKHTLTFLRAAFPDRAYLPVYDRATFFPGCFGSTAKKPSLKLFQGESSDFSPGKIAPGTSSSFSFTFSCFFFQFHIPFCYFEGGLGGVLSIAAWSRPGLGHSYLRIFVLTPLKYSTSLSATFVYIRLFPNNLITPCAPSLGPRLSLFS